MTLPTLDLVVLLPQLIVLTAALLVLVVDGLSGARSWLLAGISLVALLAAGAAAIWLSLQPGEPRRLQAMAVADGFALLFDVVIVVAAVLGVLLAYQSIPRISQQVGSYYALLLLAVVGMMTMGAALDLIVVFLALEILSLALYILAGFNRSEPRSAEASLKYFLLGAFASAFFLYGAALVYGATASLNLEAIAAALAGGSRSPAMLYLGIALLIVGFGFKVALVPFHMWTPDVYQGAPTPVTAFMSAATKAAAFAAFLRLFLTALPTAQPTWSWALAVLAAVTMTLGNVAALRQRELKRMLAYSSIAHAGYAAVGLVAGTAQGAGAVLFYLLAYAFMNVGAFGVVAALERAGEYDVARGRLAGLSERQPALAAAMAIFMFSLTGIPPFAGFFGKLYVFGAAVAAGWGWLVVIGVINSVISAYYYLQVTVEMYFAAPAAEAPAAAAAGKKGRAVAKAAAPSPAPEEGKAAPAPLSRATAAAVLAAALGTVLIGVLPA
ncbi:MAG: NADH-quinone oxidoreductase subunit N, partial [Anaerolineae bacterium]|nr:NADH-quinone oxidoreductase subunit N [Anaerolineae bacterium]